MRRLLLCLALALSAAAPAAACVNDGELSGREREFRSQYNNNGPTAMLPRTTSGWVASGLSVLFGAGALLAIGATVVASRNARRRD